MYAMLCFVCPILVVAGIAGGKGGGALAGVSCANG